MNARKWDAIEVAGKLDKIAADARRLHALHVEIYKNAQPDIVKQMNSVTTFDIDLGDFAVGCTQFADALLAAPAPLTSAGARG